MTVKHNPLMIDGGTKPSWDTDEHKYFVIDEDKNTLIANVYTKEPFKNDGYLIYKSGKPVSHLTSLEEACIRFDLYRLGLLDVKGGTK